MKKIHFFSKRSSSKLVLDSGFHHHHRVEFLGGKWLWAVSLPAGLSNRGSSQLLLFRTQNIKPWIKILTFTISQPQTVCQENDLSCINIYWSESHGYSPTPLYLNYPSLFCNLWLGCFVIQLLKLPLSLWRFMAALSLERKQNSQCKYALGNLVNVYPCIFKEWTLCFQLFTIDWLFLQ